MHFLAGHLVLTSDGQPDIVLGHTDAGDVQIFARLHGIQTVAPGSVHQVADEAAALAHFDPELPREWHVYPDGSASLFRQPARPLWLRRADGTFERAPAGWAGVEWSGSLPTDYRLELVIEPEGRDDPARQLAALVAFFTSPRQMN